MSQINPQLQAMQSGLAPAPDAAQQAQMQGQLEQCRGWGGA